MAAEIPKEYADLLTKDHFATLATVLASGQPELTPIWVDWNGEHLVYSTVVGRQKDVNVRRDPRVVVTVMDHDNRHRYIQVRGRVSKITDEGAQELIDTLAQRYRGEETYTGLREGRVAVYVEPERVVVRG